MLKKNQSTYLLILILTLSLFTRLFRLSNPNSYYFDEVYHAYTAKAYARNDPRGYEWWNPADEEGTAFEWLHPPISKLIMAGSIKIFGENSFAWRLPSAVIGTLVIYFIYLLTQKLFQDQKTSLIAAVIASLDGLLLTQSRIAMNDIYLVLFILLTLIFYLDFYQKKKLKYLFLSSIFFGISISTKWSGLFILPIIGINEGFRIALRKTKFSLKYVIQIITSFIFLPLVIYLLSFTQFFIQGHTINQFIELHNQIFHYQFGLEASHPYQSRAWQWPLLIKPVWYHVDYSKPEMIGNIYALSNPFISWFGLLAFFWFVFQILTKKNYQKFNYQLLATTYLFIWSPWIFSPRIMFYYHYTPAIPFLSIILAKFFTHKKYYFNQYFIPFITLTILSFIFFYPHWIGIPMPKIYQDSVYWLPSWK